jgi:hypothetical protein
MCGSFDTRTIFCFGFSTCCLILRKREQLTMDTKMRPDSGVDALALIEREIREAENERRPISRQMLADLVHATTALPLADAVPLVDRYCDDNAPGVPQYLADEFAVPYLKVVAVANVILAVLAYWYGATTYQAGKAAWPWLGLGTVVLAGAVWAWIKSLERYQERKTRRQSRA